MQIIEKVRSFWEKEPCGTNQRVVGDEERYTLEWFERVEEYRYEVEPFIHSLAQFTRHHGKKLLEVGVGAGTDHLQWARAGAQCYGIDLTDAAIETTQKRLALYGFESNLQQANAEELPFEDGSFDIVYSWGVIHHTERPENIISEIYRVLKPGGMFIGMMYGRRSINALQLWLYMHCLKEGPGAVSRMFCGIIWRAWGRRLIRSAS